jgi:UDP-N-acetylglucosamine 2-epimerase (non-hydrolysing)
VGRRIQLNILHVVGARPNFVKVAPIKRALAGTRRVRQQLVHTGQHYDRVLSEDFFEDLSLARPDLNLGVGSGSHGVQTGKLMQALEPVVEQFRPDWLFTVGDVNSTLAAALVAAKLQIRVAHVEAGLRSHNWRMPEEINRVLTDRLSHALFTTEASANENLHREGIPEGKVHFVGNVMIDTLDKLLPRADKLRTARALGLPVGRYVLVTLHRPANVDDPRRLAAVAGALSQIADVCECPVVFPVHPRTSRKIGENGIGDVLSTLHVLDPLRYLEFLSLMNTAGVVLTDSGGVQEETTVLGIPCVTLRPDTERPVTLTEGTNRLFDGSLDLLPEVVLNALQEERRPVRPHLWDGQAAQRIAEITVS